MITLIGLFLLIFAEFVYGNYATVYSTNWNIMYHSAVYLCVAMISFDNLIKQESKAVLYSCGAGVGYILAMLIMQLFHINEPFEEYMVSVNNAKIVFYIMALLSISLTFLVIKLWVERKRSKTYLR